ncbi:uncharacterized protein LOC120276348 [Dioscorea cayenensis subsp. rotundata]|uniref:Uncharacterized protein LOC120276348 n=1 Tax=Dioscorea cayennensis subsp. rotundata TaxID=55577 RepID=A0AB40CGA7_DIOCR|nr:uncharacterized protein LOC120276348 [Dioscorea cayenensis subsp. rotundata]
MAAAAAALRQPWTTLCTIMAADTSNPSYRACSLCDRPLPDSPSSSPCPLCIRHSSAAGSHRLFRLLISIATSDKVLIVICFDRATRAIFGGSADEFFDLCELHPDAVWMAGEMMVGEICRVTLRRPTNGNAEHLRAVSLVPLRAEFRPVIARLRSLYGAPSH